MELRSFIIPFSKNKARGTRLCFENSEKKLAEFDITVSNHTGIFNLEAKNFAQKSIVELKISEKKLSSMMAKY